MKIYRKEQAQAKWTVSVKRILASIVNTNLLNKRSHYSYIIPTIILCVEYILVFLN